MVPFVDQYQNSLKCKYAYICKKKKKSGRIHIKILIMNTFF